MEIVRIIASIANILLLLYILLLFGRLILEYIPMFNREWRPRGTGLVVAETVFTVTDPPLKLFRRLIPPLRLGPVAIDLGFPLTMLLCFVLLSVVRAVMLM
ncbi:YggT family protein [Microbacterium telephonicum]|uniref:YggT family protein n=1 Tax=Microbacterium telephonicum TaxID=1714841 RepID=A0A498C9V7_9MICO|nr:YggT family protein [Microbacterium telephonicum]RLK49650.1 YggT family protein [Microbacterium telephonicum]